MIRAAIWIGAEAEDALKWVYPMLEESCKHDPMGTPPIEIINDVLSKRAYLWVALDDEDEEVSKGFIIGSFYQINGQREFILSHAGGNMEYLVKHLDMVEEFAQANGAKQLQIPGRPGWAKVLKANGYKPVATIVAKALGAEVLH